MPSTAVTLADGRIANITGDVEPSLLQKQRLEAAMAGMSAGATRDVEGYRIVMGAPPAQTSKGGWLGKLSGGAQLTPNPPMNAQGQSIPSAPYDRELSRFSGAFNTGASLVNAGKEGAAAGAGMLTQPVDTVVNTVKRLMNPGGVPEALGYASGAATLPGQVTGIANLTKYAASKIPTGKALDLLKPKWIKVIEALGGNGAGPAEAAGGAVRPPTPKPPTNGPTGAAASTAQNGGIPREIADVENRLRNAPYGNGGILNTNVGPSEPIRSSRTPGPDMGKIVQGFEDILKKNPGALNQANLRTGEPATDVATRLLKQQGGVGRVTSVKQYPMAPGKGDAASLRQRANVVADMVDRFRKDPTSVPEPWRSLFSGAMNSARELGAASLKENK